MKQIILNGEAFSDKEFAHQLLKEAFELPDYYGSNLDALWDCLSTDFSNKMVIIRNPQLLEEKLGQYGRSLLQVFKDLKSENPHFHVVYSYPLNFQN